MNVNVNANANVTVNAWNKLTFAATAIALVLASASLEAHAFSLSTLSPQTFPHVQQPRVQPQQQQRQLEQDTVELYGNKKKKNNNRISNSNSRLSASDKGSPATLVRPMTTTTRLVEPSMLQKSGRIQQREMGAKELEELYLQSATRRTTTPAAKPKTTTPAKRATPATARTNETSTVKANKAAALNELPVEKTPLEVSEPIQENLCVKEKTVQNGGLLTRSRSSTMPGLSGGKSDRQLAYRDGVRLVEQRTGKKMKETSESKAKRKTTNGETMYKTSACVPDSMVQFANEIHQIDRITRKEEIDLGEKTQEAIRLQNLYSKLSDSLAREPTDEEWCAAAGKINMEAVRQTIEDGLEAKNKLVTSNLRMVQSVVNTYIRNGLSGQYNAGDMMQEGVMALIRAAEKFEPDRGWRFSTYALYWIRASVKRTQIFQSRIVSVPQRLYENHKRLLRVEQEMILVLDRKPTKAELGEAVGMSELQVTRCMTAMDQRCYSLDRQISNTRKPMSGDRGGDTLNDLVQSKTDDGEHTKVKRVLLREDLIETLHRHLSPNEVELLLLRYGLKKGPSHKLGGQPTIAELSEMVGLKPDKVRRIIDRSLRQLKTSGGDEWIALCREMY